MEMTPALPNAGQILQRYFGEHMKFFVVFQSFYSSTSHSVSLNSGCKTVI